MSKELCELNDDDVILPHCTAYHTLSFKVFFFYVLLTYYPGVGRNSGKRGVGGGGKGAG